MRSTPGVSWLALWTVSVYDKHNHSFRDLRGEQMHNLQDMILGLSLGGSSIQISQSSS